MSPRSSLYLCVVLLIGSDEWAEVVVCLEDEDLSGHIVAIISNIVFPGL